MEWGGTDEYSVRLGCRPNPTSRAWLLLKAAKTEISSFSEIGTNNKDVAIAFGAYQGLAISRSRSKGWLTQNTLSPCLLGLSAL
ncbi:Uncharacterized protein HZ326_28646 [Fusarium oxysporum f. sp. albedinis]|nr:Uncharacterized protein HZ326_28646 [Fusarium oxysporum f. sp. albedinis]